MLIFRSSLPEASRRAAPWLPAVLLTGLFTTGSVRSQTPTSYIGQISGYHVHATSGCSAPFTETTTDYTDLTKNDPTKNGFGTFQTSCNGYSIAMSNVKVVYDPVVTATLANGFWAMSPPLNIHYEFTVAVTAPSSFSGGGGAVLDTNIQAGPTLACEAPDQYSNPFTGTLASVTRVQPACTVNMVQISNGATPTAGQTGGTLQATIFNPKNNPTAPGIVVEITVLYQFTAGCSGTSVVSGSAHSIEAAANSIEAAACTAPVTINIDHLEVVQVIQDAKNSIPLVRDKTAEVRVYATASQDKVQVTATLSAPGRGAAQPITVRGVLNKSLPDPNGSETLNFKIDGPWVTLGGAELQVDIKSLDGSASASNQDRPTSILFAGYQWPQPYIVVPLLICLRYPSDSTVRCPEGIGDEGADPNAGSLMQKLFPVVDAFSIGIDVPGILYTPAKRVVISSTASQQSRLKRLLAIYILLNAGGAGVDQVIGWLNTTDTTGAYNHVGVLATNGDAAADEFELASLVAGNLGVPTDCPSAGDLPNTCVSFIDLPGFDVAAQVVRGAGAAKTSSGPNVILNTSKVPSGSGWVSSAQYKALLGAFRAPISPAARPEGTATRGVRAAAASPSPFLVITGDVSSDGDSGDLDPGFQVSSTQPADPSDPNGNFCLHVSGPQGALSDYCFTVPFPAGVNPAPFGVRAPWPTGANRVGLVAHGGANNGRELAALTAGSQPPVVQITSPTTGASLDAGTLNVTWNGSGGAALTYTLQYSSDGGANWSPIDSGITENSYLLDTTRQRGGSQVLIQVLASDGLNTATTTVGPLTIRQSPHLALPQGTVNFHKSLIGQGVDGTVSLGNSGTGPVTVASETMDNPVFRLVVPSVPFTINPGGQQQVKVRFTPTAVGVQTAKLSLSSDDPAQPTSLVTVQAEAIDTPAPALGVGSSTVDFGNVLVGKFTDASFPVTNFGPGLLTISNIQSSNAAYASTAPKLPFTVPPGAPQDVTVHFAPTTPGAQNSVLTLATDDPDQPSAKVNVTGTGVTASSGTPGFAPGALSSAASYGAGGVAPGEFVTIFGSNLGPPMLAGLQLGSNGRVSTSTGNTQILFDGIPAPMYYSSAGQVAAIVPYEVYGKTFTQVGVIYNGVKSNVAAVPVVPSAPALFTADSSGKGQGSFLNQDSTVNSASNPAPAGSTVILYGTGEGQTSPRGIDGQVAAVPLPSPLLPVSVTIGGVNAPVGYAGAAPGFVEGVLQVNVAVPNGLSSGNQPVVLTVGNASSPAGVTIAVKGSQPSSAPQLSLSTTTLAFGNVNTGQTKDLSVTVSNRGNAALNVSSTLIVGGGFLVISPTTPFAVQPGGAQSVTIRFAPAAAGVVSATLRVASNDASSPASVSLSGTGVTATPAVTVLISDDFRRANASACFLGQADLALGGSGAHYYLPDFPSASGPIGASLVSNALQNNGLDYGGVQLTASPAACASGSARGEALPQNLNISVDLLVPVSSGNVTDAGPYLHGRAAAAGDGLIGGASTGYWVQLVSTGEVRVRSLNPFSTIATAGVPASFNATVVHTLVVAVQGNAMQASLDGRVLPFIQNGSSSTTVTLPASGANDGTVGIAFGSEDNRGLAGGQRATNLVITAYSPLQ